MKECSYCCIEAPSPPVGSSANFRSSNISSREICGTSASASTATLRVSAKIAFYQCTKSGSPHKCHHHFPVHTFKATPRQFKNLFGSCFTLSLPQAARILQYHLGYSLCFRYQNKTETRILPYSVRNASNTLYWTSTAYKPPC